MDDTTTMTQHTPADPALHEYYLTQINHLVETGRDDLVDELARDYDQVLRSTHRARHAA